MCSYKSISDANHDSLLSENWENDLWSNVLSPNPNPTNTSTQSQYSQNQTVQTVSGQNEIHALQNCQVQISAAYQNLETSSLLSPTWEDSVSETTQSFTDMSTYFSTFNPSSQFQEISLHQNPVRASLNVMTPNTANRNMHSARISLVRTGNGSFKAIVKRKRKRTVFTTEQLEVLEQVFSKKPYVTRDERQLLVEKLQVNDKSIKIWFQNRRLKNKRGDNQDEVMQDGSNCTIFDRLDTVESKIIERTDEFGYVTLDDKIMNDLVKVIDDYLSSNTVPVETIPDIDSSPIYEPISPASDYSCEENVTSWQHSEPNASVQELIDIESIISI